MKITKHFTFEASHVLPKHPGKCSRLHGHSWKLAVTIDGPVDPETGFVVDYGVVKGLVDENIISRLDHTHLGQGVAHCYQSISDFTNQLGMFHPYFGHDFYPSSENLCRAIFKLLNPLIQELGKHVRLDSITIDETCTSSATWSRADEHFDTQHNPRG